jgi:hypothetical protein
LSLRHCWALLAGGHAYRDYRATDDRAIATTGSWLPIVDSL